MCTRPTRPISTPGQIFIQRRDVPVQMCQHAKFSIASSKIHKLGGSHDKKFRLCHVLLVPLITGYPNGFRSPIVAIGSQSLRRIPPLVGLQA